MVFNFIFFARPKKTKQKKRRLNLAFGFPRATVACGGSANSPRQVGAQTVQTLVPHATVSLGCIEWKKRTVVPVKAAQNHLLLGRIIAGKPREKDFTLVV